MYEMHHQSGLRPSIAIIELSWPILDAKYYDYYTYWQEFGTQYLAASERLDLPVTLQTRYQLAVGSPLSRLFVLSSPAYFQNSADTLWKAGLRLPVPEFTYVVIPEKGHPILLADGSLSMSPPNKPIELRWTVYNPYIFDPGTVKMLETIIDAMKDDGTDVVLLIPPLHPAFYQQAITTDALNQLDSYYQDLADRKDLTLLGSYNPDRYGCAAIEFTDQDHPYWTCFAKILCTPSETAHASPLLPYCRSGSDK